MLKKITSFIICLALLFSLAGCGKVNPNLQDTNQSISSQNSSDGVSGQVSSLLDGSQITPSSSTTPTQNKPVTSVGATATGKATSGNIIIDNSSNPNIQAQVGTSTTHKKISAENYYQYGGLSSSQKSAYRAISAVIEDAVNVVDLRDYNIKVDDIEKILSCVLTDNPQYFWVTNDFTYGYRVQDNIAAYVTLYYTDGRVVDEVDDNSLKPTKLADRQVISQKINQFNQKSTLVINSISVSFSMVEKEKLIHDYIVKNTVYDNNAAAQVGSDNSNDFAFSAYGALCEGKAVCSGYSKIFQYLCYCVGINVTQITGNTDRSPHMWACVQLDSNWYHTDVTWADTVSKDYTYYGYFNVTEASIKKDHSIDTATLRVPVSNATNYSFENTFGMAVTDINTVPNNYQKSIDYTIKNSEKYIIINLCGNSVSSDYLRKHFFNSNSTMQIYCKSKGYNISLKNGYVTLGAYLYLILN